MQQYLELLRDILENGEDRSDRTGVGTRGVFGRQLRFDLFDGFPLLTTKRVHTKAVVAELLWMLSGSTSIEPLVRQGVSIWTDWPLARYNQFYGQLRAKPPIAAEQRATVAEFEAAILADQTFAQTWGNLGPVYGAQWRHWQGKTVPAPGDFGTREPGPEIDQLAQLLDNLRRDPFSRRHILNAWNVADLPQMALAPCHCLAQFNVRQLSVTDRIEILYQQRSADWETACTELEKIGYSAAADGSARQRALTTLGLPERALDCQLYQRSDMSACTA